MSEPTPAWSAATTDQAVLEDMDERALAIVDRVERELGVTVDLNQLSDADWEVAWETEDAFYETVMRVAAPKRQHSGTEVPANKKAARRGTRMPPARPSRPETAPPWVPTTDDDADSSNGRDAPARNQQHGPVGIDQHADEPDAGVVDKQAIVVVSEFADRGDVQPCQRTLSWPRLRDWLGRHQILGRREQARLWSPVRYQPGATRAKHSVVEVTALVFDVDDGTEPDAITFWLGDLDYVISSTYSHTRAHPRLRVVVRLVEPIPGAEFDDVWRRANQHLLHGHVDPSTKDRCRMFFVPSCPPGAETVSVQHPGRALDWRALPSVPRPHARRKRNQSQAEADTDFDRRRAQGLLARWERDLADTGEGARHNRLLGLSRAAGGLVASGLLGAADARAALLDACEANGLIADDGERSVVQTLNDGLAHGGQSPWVPDDLPNSPAWQQHRRVRLAAELPTGLPTASPTGTSFEFDGDLPTFRSLNASEGRKRDTGTGTFAAGTSAAGTFGLVVVGERPEPGPRRFRIARLMPEGVITLMYGDSGIGKSFVGAAMGLCVATGTRFAGLDVIQGRVLYVDAELDEEEFGRRAYRLARGLGLARPPDNLLYARLPQSLATDKGRTWLLGARRAAAADLTVLDSLSFASFGARFNEGGDITAILMGLHEAGTLLALDHSQWEPRPSHRRHGRGQRLGQHPLHVQEPEE
jgi:hypothetical protein